MLTSCTTPQQVVYRNCDCVTQNNVFANPYWSWGLYDPFWNFNRWSWYPYNFMPRYYVPPQPYRPQTPSRYDRRRTIQPQPERRVVHDNVYPNQTRPTRTPVYRNTTPSNRNRIQNNESPSHRIPMTAPSRNYTPRYLNPPQSAPSRNNFNQNRSMSPSNRTVTPSRGDRSNY
jgi:hypothetical protein